MAKKEYYLNILQQVGFDDEEIKNYSKLTEENLEKLVARFTPKKRGRKGDFLSSEEVISKIKEKGYNTKTEISFDLFSGKGRQKKIGRMKGFFQGFKVYAVVEYHNETNGQNEKKEIDISKI